jgi:hypothetical protein
MYKKSVQKKKRKQHKPSILQKRDGTCYLCIRMHGDYRIHQVLHEHHVYGGPNRPISEAEGFKAYLCLAHHEFGPEAVHENNRIMRILQQDTQREYEKTHTRKEFMELIGRNYMEADNER